MAKKAQVLIKKDGFEARIITSRREICRIIGISPSTYHSQIRKKGFFENKEFVVRDSVEIETIARNSPNIKRINDLIGDVRREAGKAISQDTRKDNSVYDD